MKSKLLLPNKYKKIGWFILVPAVIMGIILIFSGVEGVKINTRVFAIYSDEILGESHLFSFIETNITNTVVGILFIVGGLMVGLSKEKNEDEFISNLRLSSLLWAVLVNYLLLLLSFAFIWLRLSKRDDLQYVYCHCDFHHKV